MSIKKNNVQKKTHILIFAAYYASIVAAFFLTFKFLIPFFMPFLVGFLIAFILKPITCAISKKTSLSRKICGALVVILFYCLITISIWFICAKIIDAIQTFANNNQGFFKNQIMPAIKTWNNHINQALHSFFPHLNVGSPEMLEKISDSISDSITECSKAIIVWIANIGATIPNFLIGLTFAITSSIYISADYVRITKTLNSFLPNNLKKWVLKTKDCTTATITKYIRAYSFLMALNFFALSIGFLIIGIENPIGVAALAAICDAVPFLGSGLIIFPWIITLMIVQNFGLALKIGIIFLVISISRSFLEPKILGNQIGMHPVLTLISVYVGIKLFGFLGIILIPIAAQIGFVLYKNHITLNKQKQKLNQS